MDAPDCPGHHLHADEHGWNCCWCGLAVPKHRPLREDTNGRACAMSGPDWLPPDRLVLASDWEPASSYQRLAELGGNP